MQVSSPQSTFFFFSISEDLLEATAAKNFFWKKQKKHESFRIIQKPYLMFQHWHTCSSFKVAYWGAGGLKEAGATVIIERVQVSSMVFVLQGGVDQIK